MKIKMITPILQMRKLDTLKNSVLDLRRFAPGLLYAMRAGECDGTQGSSHPGHSYQTTVLSMPHTLATETHTTLIPQCILFSVSCHRLSPLSWNLFLPEDICSVHNPIYFWRAFPSSLRVQLPHLLLCAPTRVISTLYQHQYICLSHLEAKAKL